MYVGMELTNAQKQGKDYTTQKNTNVIQKEYPTSVPLYHCVE